MPKKQRQLATRSAILAKVKDDEVKAVDTFPFDEVKTKNVVTFLEGLKLEGSALLVTAEYNRNAVLSARNLPKVAVVVVGDMNAYDVLKYKWLVIEKQALEALAGAAS